MAVQKDKIVFGDTYHISFTCFLTSSDARPNDRQEVYPVMAEISLWNVIDGVWVPMNDEGDIMIEVLPQGNKIDYIIPATGLAVDGDYKAFVTGIFDVDGEEHRVTKIRAFRVLARE